MIMTLWGGGETVSNSLPINMNLVVFEPHLHSMAWSMDLKDLGRPFRKFWML